MRGRGNNKKFIRILRRNGFKHIRDSGSHNIYESPKGKHISVPHHLAPIIAKRLIKENNLKHD